MSLPLFLLPEMTSDARRFGPEITDLSPARSVGVGDGTGNDSMAVLAAEVLAQAPERFALAGLSTGRMIAMEVTRQAPGRVARLTLLGTNPRAEPSGVKPSGHHRSRRPAAAVSAR